MPEIEETDDHGSRKMPAAVRGGLMKVPGGGMYLKAAHRVLWFREEHPLWSIETELIVVNELTATVKATIKDDLGRILATAHKSQTLKEFPRGYIEKAESGSVARALQFMGYGTIFGELDEGDNFADAPQPRRAEGEPQAVSTEQDRTNRTSASCTECYAPAGKLHGKGCKQIG